MGDRHGALPRQARGYYRSLKRSPGELAHDGPVIGGSGLRRHGVTDSARGRADSLQCERFHAGVMGALVRVVNGDAHGAVHTDVIEVIAAALSRLQSDRYPTHSGLGG